MHIEIERYRGGERERDCVCVLAWGTIKSAHRTFYDKLESIKR